MCAKIGRQRNNALLFFFSICKNGNGHSRLGGCFLIVSVPGIAEELRCGLAAGSAMRDSNSSK